jgi:type II secretory pathway component PulF
VLVLLVALLALANCAGLAVYVFPKLILELEQRELQAPTLTAVSLQGLHLAHQWWWALLAGLVGLALLWHVVSRPEVRPDRRGLALALLALLLTAASIIATLGCVAGLMKISGLLY